MKSNLPPMPNPTEEDLESPEFNAIWDVIKNWDISVKTHSSFGFTGTSGGNGSHVKLILESLKPVLRNYKIEQIVKD